VTVPSPARPGRIPSLDRAVDVLTGTGHLAGWQAAADRRRGRPAPCAEGRIEYGFCERKEVMCSDRQYA
jgi:hypothetical protein